MQSPSTSPIQQQSLIQPTGQGGMVAEDGKEDKLPIEQGQKQSIHLNEHLSVSQTVDQTGRHCPI